MPRQSARLNPAPVPSSTPLPPYYTPPLHSSPFLRLSPELHDHILTFLLQPHSTPTLRRSLAHSLLGLHPTITPLVRRRLFAKVGLTLDDPKERDQRFLSIVESHAGVAECVRSLRIRAPTPPEPVKADIEAGGPGAALVPESRLEQGEVVQRVSRVLGRCERMSELEVEMRVGTRVEGVVEKEEEEEGERLKELEEALMGLKGVRKLGVAVAHRRLKLQVFAEGSGSGSAEAGGGGEGWISPWIPSLSTWSHLTHLDLWRIRLHFPRSPTFSIPEPTFSLHEVQLQSSELGGSRELIWLFGEPGSKRGAKLEKLLIRDVEFIETPESSEPLLAIFPCLDPSSDLSSSSSANSIPAFHDSLDSLVLILPHPILPPTATSSSQLSTFLSPLTSLRQLELGGPGLPLPLLTSLFSPHPHSTSTQLTILNLSYAPSLPIPSLLSLLKTNLGQFGNLRTLDILRAGTHPRTWEWERISSTPTPVWEWTEGEWRELEKMICSLRDLRRKEGGGGGGGGGVRLCRDGTEVEVEYDSQAEEEEESESEEETDGEALFEPSSEPGEAEAGWNREESVESDW
ncbi:hypothetical protein BCR35DRAFT_332771 [Leucosporidium creatinivorum]|uniref:Uncharacterized protein n=1 Tax=Leucosporidium creatinivorum TaxID=106004 RepID=A0A1Y2EY46_9BASI|nr:hypothetical protein BCR35DRAFT_332771 [Leucosporidium creatinivorum]